MKKITSIIFGLVLAINLTACEKTNSIKNPNIKGNPQIEIQKDKLEVKEVKKEDQIVNTQNVSEKSDNSLFAELFSSITETEFKENLAGKDDVVVIDIRTPNEIAQGVISENPLKIDFYEENFKEELGKLDKNKTYFIYCAHANRTREAKKMMKDLGFTKVYDLKGGIITWKGEMYGQTPRSEIVQKFLGKPSVIILAGTFCPHCQTAMPVFEEKVWDKYNSKANIFVNVVDGKKFPQKRIGQGYDATLTFKALTGEDCGYVPSWVILDKDGEVAKKACGASKSMNDITETLDGLLN